MEGAEFVLFGLLVAVAGLVVLAGFLKIPYPVVLVLGGLVLGVVPGVPRVELDPELVLLLFLPPLLYAAAFFSSLRDLRANVGAISLLSIGLVLVTTFTVAAVAHAVVDGLSWPAAVVLGAIVSPTDPVAASAIARRLDLPRPIVAIVEGESLINDATALVAYRFAVGAVVTGAFSVGEAGLQFVAGAAGGSAIGLVVGWLVAQVRSRLDDPPVEITISLFTAYAAYLPAEALGFSGVLAAVTVGIYLGWRAPALITPSTRIQAYSIWEILIFLLNSLLFVLIGLQLPAVLDGLSGEPVATLVGYAAIVSAVVVGTRVAFVFLFTYLPRWRLPRVGVGRSSPPPQWTFLVSWSGMRGAVSLAAALALPFETAAGTPFPGRDLILFLAFSVILATLVVQGLSLPAVIRALGVEPDRSEEAEEVEARLRAAEAAIERIDDLAGEDWVRDETAERMRGFYDYRRRRFAARAGDQEGADSGDYEEHSAAYQRLRAEVLGAERAELLRLRSEGRIGDEVMRRVERDLDLEESRLETPAARPP